ncbi:RDD family protein [Haladaptatus sp. DJG-WS-42]|uniref:RDD family protein n=1 Tax=Haladaptatus sp. DJG-WS-42 TaxID=3120516 RepID=UPI0030CE8759
MKRPTPQLGTETDTLGARIVAWIIDAILMAIITGALVAPLNVFGNGGATLGGSIGLLLTLAYFIYMEGTYGQTFGKRLMKIVVVKEDGGPTDMEASVIRNLLRLVDNFPFIYLVGLLFIWLSDRDQRLGDMLADTVVVRVAPQS